MQYSFGSQQVIGSYHWIGAYGLSKLAIPFGLTCFAHIDDNENLHNTHHGKNFGFMEGLALTAGADRCLSNLARHFGDSTKARHGEVWK